MRHNSATTIKCKFSNQIHKLIASAYGVYGIKRNEKWRIRKNKLTDEQKIQLFDKIVQIHDEISEEYSNCLYKRRERKRIRKYRGEQYYINKAEKRKARKEFNS